jgi:hypothetical protein
MRVSPTKKSCARKPQNGNTSHGDNGRKGQMGQLQNGPLCQWQNGTYRNTDYKFHLEFKVVLLFLRATPRFVFPFEQKRIKEIGEPEMGSTRSQFG